MFADAATLAGLDPESRRADYAPESLRPGRVFHFYQKENNLVGGVVYRVAIRERDADRLVFETVNATAMAFLFLDVIEAGGFRQLYFIERREGGIWRYYSLIWISRGSDLAVSSPASFKNRAVAYFRYLAGLKMDREPPAAP